MCKKNTDYPLYTIPMVTDFHDLIRQKAETCPEKVAFAWYVREEETVTLNYYEEA